MVQGSRTSDWSGVGALVAVNSQDQGVVFCTGTLIAADRVLTAGHCIAFGELYESEGLELYFVTGEDIYQDYDELAVITEMFQHPDYDEVSLEHDLGVLALERELGGEVMPLNTDTLGSSWEGRDLWHVGYGITGWDLEDIGIKREVQLPVYEVYATFTLHFDPGGGNLCLGDSGGPAIDPASGDIVGVASFVWAAKDEVLCDEGGAATARVDIDVSWIEEVSSQAASETEEGGTEESDGSSSVVEPSTGAAGQLPSDEQGLSCGVSGVRSGVNWAIWGVLLGAGRRRAGAKG